MCFLVVRILYFLSQSGHLRLASEGTFLTNLTILFLESIC
jgi:hypothetical protein